MGSVIRLGFGIGKGSIFTDPAHNRRKIVPDAIVRCPHRWAAVRSDRVFGWWDSISKRPIWMGTRRADAGRRAWGDASSLVTRVLVLARRGLRVDETTRSGPIFVGGISCGPGAKSD